MTPSIILEVYIIKNFVFHGKSVLYSPESLTLFETSDNDLDHPQEVWSVRDDQRSTRYGSMLISLWTPSHMTTRWVKPASGLKEPVGRKISQLV